MASAIHSAPVDINTITQRCNHWLVSITERMHTIDDTANTMIYIYVNDTRKCYTTTQREEGTELCNFTPATMRVSLRRNRWGNLIGLCKVTLRRMKKFGITTPLLIANQYIIYNNWLDTIYHAAIF